MNIQQPTSNTEQPVLHAATDAVLWMLVVRCSMFDVSNFLLATTLIPKTA
jgi:hypothetical protein